MLSTLKIPGYDITEVIHEGLNTNIYRGVSQPKQERVILKVLKAEYPSLEQITRLKHEYSITENLDLSNVVKVIGLESHDHRLVLVAQDFGGISLKQFLCGGKLSIPTFLDIAVQLAQALISLHTHHIIHKDIKPSNIIINPQSGQVKLTDFSIASRLVKETAQLTNFNQLEGTLAYMSPEQTGRMNRIVDYRSDFYSLGVTFYEMLSQLPFNSFDPLELVYCHIAKQPTPIQELCPEVPAVIAAIVTKLMAKSAEDRYQSAAGLLADLELCRSTGDIPQFIPGQRDRTAQLLPTQKLYGRESEVAALMAAFERSLVGIELVLVSGYSGIGKSSLVNEVHKPIVRQRGNFIAGKFDQMGRNIPYASIIQAFQFLMRQLLTESAEQLQTWKEKLLGALGSNGQVIIDVIPEVELIVGKQPNVPELGATESLNRFNRVFQSFIQVFAQPEHPLVLFLDDLQWVDSASLKLLQVLMTNPDSKYLLLIGAYRDHEVSPTHPLMKTLSEIESAGTVINNIVLRPLEISHVQLLVADTLGETENHKSTAEDTENTENSSVNSCRTGILPVISSAVQIQNQKSKIDTLAELLFNKTQGNPFFLTQLLKTLHQEKLLTFDFTCGQWQWDIKHIQSTGIADKSVVELVAGNIEKLPEATQTVLKLAACIGARFSLDVLATVSELPNVASVLQPALQHGLVLPLNNEYKVPLLFGDEELNTFGFDRRVQYRFLHDRVQQAAYSLIPQEQRNEAHLKIGQLLLKNTPTEELEVNIFDIVNQLNVGIDTISQQSQKDELARLNLIAGRKAKAAAAYEVALKYLNTGLELLQSNSWQLQYDLTLALYQSAAEAAYLTGNFEQMEQCSDIVLQQAKTILDKVKVYEVKIQTRVAQTKLIEAIKLGLQVLELLGIPLRSAPTQLDIQQALQETASYLNGKSIEDLINLPVMTDTHKLAAMQLLASISSPAFVAAPALFPLTILSQVNLSILHGNASSSAFAYATYGIILQGIVQDIEASYQFGLLALNLIEKLNATEFKSKTFMVVAVFTKYAKEHLRETLPLLQSAYYSGVENGDLEFAAHAATYQCRYSYFAGKELAFLEREMANFSNALAQFKQAAALNHHELFRQVVLNLLGRVEKPSHLVGEAYNEEQLLPLHREMNDRGGLHYFYTEKLFLCYLFGEYSQAVVYADQARMYLDGATGNFNVPIFHFYDSLAQLAVYFDSESTLQHSILARVEANQEKMRSWADYAPMNFQHKYDLVEAERCRVLGDNYQAMEYYDRAIQKAAENGYIQVEAIANERAAQFYLSLGKQKIALVYMTDAYYGYIKWGAIAKVGDLEKRYPELIIRSENTTTTITDINKTLITNTTHLTLSTISSSQILDLTTVIKATHAIQSEIILENLPQTLLEIILENAGAQKGCLILEKDNQLFIEAIDTSIEQTDIVRQSTLVEESPDVPLALINYVARTRQPLVIKDATIDPICENDPYIKCYQCKSVLCVPIIYQGNFIGIFYLENNLATDAFTATRLQLLKILASSAAIAIKNARLLASEQEKSQQLQHSVQKLQQTQAQLVQTEKISQLGQLVAGVAHEVNNPVSFISGNLSHANQYTQDLINLLNLYRREFPQPGSTIEDEIDAIDLEYLLEDLPKMISSMNLGVDRICDIMQSLRNYSRTDGYQKTTVNIHSGIDTTLMILSHRLKAQPKRTAIQVVKEYGELPAIQCYPGQLNQVFMNLLANAIDAIEEGMGHGASGMVRNNSCSIPIAHCPLPIAHCPTIRIRTTASDEQVTIAFADNGPGMSEEVRQRVFQSFFTTKPEGKGTGLGLSISYQIVTQTHGGTLQCFSSPGEGTEFVIQIPIIGER